MIREIWGNYRYSRKPPHFETSYINSKQRVSKG